MRVGKLLKWLACGLAGLSALFAFQRPFRQFDGVEYCDRRRPAAGRLPGKDRVGFRPPDVSPGSAATAIASRDLDWHIGVSLWTQDFPRADRHFSLAVRRLTRIHVRSVEQPVNLDEGDAYDWPWLYAVQVGEWGLTDHQGQELREYLLRGGFFMADDFHGNAEWAEFESRIRKALPEFPIREIADDDPIFHTVYDLDHRIQVPGEAHLRAGYKSNNGPSSRGAHWRAIYDGQGRIIVAISYNSDIGDAWEWADDPYYPAKFSDFAIRLGVNNIVYAMTH